MKCNDYTFDQIEEGQSFEFKRTLTDQDVQSFAQLTGDQNPLHTDPEYAATTPFEKPVAHGMLASSLFSTLVGMVCPGKKNLYFSQTLQFQKPIFPGSELTVKGIVAKKIESLKMLSISTTIEAEGEVKINGEAKVKLLE